MPITGKWDKPSKTGQPPACDSSFFLQLLLEQKSTDHHLRVQDHNALHHSYLQQVQNYVDSNISTISSVTFSFLGITPRETIVDLCLICSLYICTM